MEPVSRRNSFLEERSASVSPGFSWRNVPPLFLWAFSEGTRLDDCGLTRGLSILSIFLANLNGLGSRGGLKDSSGACSRLHG